MADLIYAISASLDGYIADDGGNLDWTDPPSDDAHLFFNGLQHSVGTFLCGRRMYEAMRVWDTFVLGDLPDVQRDFAEAWRETDKVVYSTTLESAPEPRTRVERTFDIDAVRALKDGSDRHLQIGGADLAGQAIRAGLVDRYLLRLVPTIIGGGTPVFPDSVRSELALQTTRRFDDGSIMLDLRTT